MAEEWPATEQPLLDRLLGSVDATNNGWYRGEWARASGSLLGARSGRFTRGSIGPAVVRRGRSDITQHPEPAVLTMLVRYSEPPQPGDRVDLILDQRTYTVLDLPLEPFEGPSSQALRTRRRFAGEVVRCESVGDLDDLVTTDPIYGGRSGVWQVTAVDQRARMTRFDDGDSPWVQEDAGQRAATIINHAGSFLPTPSDRHGFPLNRSPVVLAKDIDRQSHGALLDDLDSWTGNVTTLGRDVTWRLAVLGGRGVVTPSIDLSADQVSSDLQWSVDDGAKVTRARVTYGAEPPGGGEQASVEVVNEPAEVYGSEGNLADRRPVALATELATQADALRVATELVGRRSLPQWRVSPVTVDLRALLKRGRAEDIATIRQLLFAHPEHALIRLRGFPTMPTATDDAPGPRSNGLLWLLGTTETFGPHEWTITLDVAPYEALADSLTWDQVPADVRWDRAPRWVQWVTATAWQPLVLGTASWRDVPPEVAWLQAPASLTWDQVTDAAQLTP
jgi:hypothetical protein